MTRSAIVTGASRGIGRAVAEMLLADGWRVLGLSRTDPAIGHPAFAWQHWDAAGAAPRLEGVYDALIHCAGVRGPYGPLWETDPAEWVQTVATNLLGTHNVVRAALPLLQRSEDGRVLLFSGGGAFSPEPGYSAYGVSKRGVVALVESLAEELRGTTVTINAIAPGFIATGIHAGTPNEGKSDSGVAMANAVECVHHMLSAATRGLTGKTVSAQWDDFRSIDQTTVDAVNASEMGTTTRHKIGCVRALVRPKRLVAV